VRENDEADSVKATGACGEYSDEDKIMLKSSSISVLFSYLFIGIIIAVQSLVKSLSVFLVWLQSA
jgi:hypothetical protein